MKTADRAIVSSEPAFHGQGIVTILPSILASLHESGDKSNRSIPVFIPADQAYYWSALGSETRP